MKSKKFVESLRIRTLESNLKNYQDILNDVKNPKDTVWNEIYTIYQSLNAKQKESFNSFIRLIGVNTISHILGIIDGTTTLDEKHEEFELISSKDGEVLSGDLQDTFLEMEEEL